jgi:hypothetical protein
MDSRNLKNNIVYSEEYLVEIKNNSTIDGFGLFANSDIAKGTCILNKLFIGQLSKFEINRIPNEFCERIGMFGARIFIYAMNHSCSPNTCWDRDGRLLASTDIGKGKEITYDYATLEFGTQTTFKWKCNCKSDNCRLKITSNDLLDSMLFTSYKGQLPSWIEEEVTDYFESRIK